MKIKTLFLLLLCQMFIMTNVLAQNIQERDSIQYRIKQVENSLSPIVRIAGKPLWNIEERMQDYNLAGLSIAVINDFQVEWAKGYGVTNVETKTKVNTETVFQAASMSKTVNAVALLKIADKQNISLDSNINSLLTSWKFPYNESINNEGITLRQLLSHTAGLSTHGFGGYKNSKDLPSIIEILEGVKPANSEKVLPIIPPNQEFKYSGGGTMLSQLILSDIQNSSYEAFVEENIFQPLQMNSSFYSVELDKYPDQIACGHLDNGKVLKNKYNIYPESAAAGLWVTPTELAKLLIDIQLSLANKNSMLLSNYSAEQMITPTLKNEVSALGTFIENHNGEKYAQHSGANKAFRAKYYFGTSCGKGVVVMVNGTNTEIIEEIIRSVAIVYDWPGFELYESSDETILTESNLTNYIGTYSLDNRNLQIILEDGVLVAQERKKWRANLIPATETSFIVENVRPQATVEFINDENGKVTKLLMQQGEHYEWLKTE
ncbi:serine hydrolase domain-containing protein [Catalinimonas niigatensis]|uniref:serine hydrolase domain-containing protein n=1 Tax=Catalinimonas niigatensis TaxID=1397264 RepID=UPI00266515BD|nr:serine hydrolase domain-containing protein [Catalinimonas niigatensis]WPP49660.1 serine hydrolase domain-containing protein [Catalinimonas niigatensis]